MTDKDKSYFHTKIVALRKSIQALEEELGKESPVLPKRKNRNDFREHLENAYAIGSWRKPEYLKKRNKKTLAETKAGN